MDKPLKVGSIIYYDSFKIIGIIEGYAPEDGYFLIHFLSGQDSWAYPENLDLYTTIFDEEE